MDQSIYLAKAMAHVLLLRTLHAVHPFWKAAEWRTVARALSGGGFPSAVRDLESEVCRLTGAQFALATNLGRSAIQVALEAWRFPPGSEVIVPTFGCTGVLTPVVKAGLEPVLVDIDDDFNVNVESVRRALTDKSRAVIFPHLGGKFGREMPELLDLARQRGLKVIDDACQAFGLQVGGRWAGTLGDVGVFSFGLGKTLFGPGGGMLITDDPAVIAYCRGRTLPQESPGRVRARLWRFAWKYGLQRVTFPLSVMAQQAGKLRRAKADEAGALHHQGGIERYDYPVHGMADVEAALALAQVRRHPEIIGRSQANAQALLASDVWAEAGLLPPEPADHIFTKFIVTAADGPALAAEFKRRLRSHGVQVESTYTPLHLRPPFAHFRRGDVSKAEERWQATFAIPVGPHLGRADVQRIINALRADPATA